MADFIQEEVPRKGGPGAGGPRAEGNGPSGKLRKEVRGASYRELAVGACMAGFGQEELQSRSKSRVKQACGKAGKGG